MRLDYLRLTALFRVARDKFVRDGIVDTGTALTVFPESVWRSFGGEIEWLRLQSEKLPESWWLQIRGLTGGEYPCRVGRVSLTLMDACHNEIEPISVIGKFAEDGGKLNPRILLGLAHGIMQGRQLHVDPDRREAWLEDRA